MLPEISILYFCVAFQSGGVDLSKPIILTCGGAMVAPFVTFALSVIGSNAPVYDVSLKHNEIVSCNYAIIGLLYYRHQRNVLIRGVSSFQQ